MTVLLKKQIVYDFLAIQLSMCGYWNAKLNEYIDTHLYCIYIYTYTIYIYTTWNAKCPILLGSFTPKASNYCLKHRALGFPGISELYNDDLGRGSASLTVRPRSQLLNLRSYLQNPRSYLQNPRGHLQNHGKQKVTIHHQLITICHCTANQQTIANSDGRTL